MIPATGLHTSLDSFARNHSENATSGRTMIPNYAERRRYGKRVSSGFVEIAINMVVGKRYGKRQQMKWSKTGAHLMLQTRTRTLDRTLRGKFEQWYTGLKDADRSAEAEPLTA